MILTVQNHFGPKKGHDLNQKNSDSSEVDSFKTRKTQGLTLCWNSNQLSTWAHKCNYAYNLFQFSAGTRSLLDKKKSLASHAVACIVPFILFRSEFRLDVYVRCPQLLCRWNGNGMKNENGIKYLHEWIAHATEVKGRNIPEDIFM